MEQQYLSREKFITSVKSQATDLFYIENENKNIRVAISNYGARIIGLWILSPTKKWIDIVAGFDTIQAYLGTNETYFGASIGRFANRIDGGKFNIQNKKYHLSQNNTSNHLHGGEGGFHKKIWTLKKHTKNALSLHLFSPDGEEGYPGNLNTEIIFSLTENNLLLEYHALADADTHLNMTHHSFFNLNGDGGNIGEHLLQIDAKNYTPVNKKMITTGSIDTVKNTPFDFTQSKKIAQDINTKNEQLEIGNGYDHNFVLTKKGSNGLQLAAIAKGDISKLEMKLYTNALGLQLYTGNFLAGKEKLRNEHRDTQRSFFCLEPQGFPNSPNHPQFPSTLIKANEPYKVAMAYHFDF